MLHGCMPSKRWKWMAGYLLLHIGRWMGWHLLTRQTLRRNCYKPSSQICHCEAGWRRWGANRRHRPRTVSHRRRQSRANNWSLCLVGTLGVLGTLVEDEVEVVEHGAAAAV
ncbi:hypothetical protein SLE2022_101370 [Rubroshorea leprosula]